VQSTNLHQIEIQSVRFSRDDDVDSYQRAASRHSERKFRISIISLPRIRTIYAFSTAMSCCCVDESDKSLFNKLHALRLLSITDVRSREYS
jgi:hypothetical protein